MLINPLIKRIAGKTNGKEAPLAVSAKQKADKKQFKDAETKARASYKTGDK